MLKNQVLLAFLLLLLTSQSYQFSVQTGQFKCEYKQTFVGYYLAGCVDNDNCKKYTSFQEAYQKCCNSPSCGGITWSSYSIQSGNDMVNFGYQLRKGGLPMKVSNTKEISYPKTTRVQTVQVFNPSQQCALSNQYKNSYLGGCVNNCVGYPTLQDAAYACSSNLNCAGITWSSFQQDKGINDMVNFSYQLRAQSVVTPISNTIEQSWLLQQRFNQVPQAHTCNYDNQKNNSFLGGCVPGDDCRGYSNFDDAAAVCCSLSSCGGITYSSWNAKNGNDMVNFNYQLRATSKPTPIATTNEISWPLLNRQMPQNTSKCTISKQYPFAFLGGCVNNCQNFKTLQDALNACCSNPQCGGVTWSSWQPSSGVNDMVNFSYQLRQAGTPTNIANTREHSWVITKRP